MIDERYLKYLAQASSTEEFLLKFAIAIGNDISSDVAEYEKDYYNRVKDCTFYAKKFIKDGKISFEDCINSKFPILIKAGITRDPCKFGDIYSIRFYNSKGEESKIELDLDLLNDMQTKHGIDINAEIEHMLEYELEHSK